MLTVERHVTLIFTQRDRCHCSVTRAFCSMSWLATASSPSGFAHVFAAYCLLHLHCNMLFSTAIFHMPVSETPVPYGCHILVVTYISPLPLATYLLPNFCACSLQLLLRSIPFGDIRSCLGLSDVGTREERHSHIVTGDSKTNSSH